MLKKSSFLFNYFNRLQITLILCQFRELEDRWQVPLNGYTILAGEEDIYKDQARDDIGDCTKDFSEIQEEGAAVLPVELWVDVKNINDQMTTILIEYDEVKMYF